MENKVDKSIQTDPYTKKYHTIEDKKEAIKKMALQHYRKKVLENENRNVDDGRRGRKKINETDEQKKERINQYKKKYILKKKQQQQQQQQINNDTTIQN
jgi:hypothetical protein